MTRHTRLFFSLMRIAAGNASRFPVQPTADDWQALLAEAQRQAVAGWTFAAIERLPEEQRPPRDVLLSWYARCEQVRQANRQVNADAVAVCHRVKQDGFSCCVLKGQGLSTLYPKPLLRTPGDIDLWVDGGYQRVLPYIRQRFPETHVCFHHAEVSQPGVTCVEYHFIPIWLNSPVANYRLQRYFRDQAARQFAHEITLPEGAGQITMPTATFNAVYVLLHIFRHLLEEGVGLRQVTDYYYCLQQLSEEQRSEVRSTLSRLGMTHFAAAVMYVLREALGMSESALLLSPDERRGRKLLREIMLAGNFGHHDSRTDWGKRQNAWGRFVETFRRNLRFLSDYPVEVLCDPLSKIRHYLWHVTLPWRYPQPPISN